MRIFNSAIEMIREVERDLWEMGIRVESDTMQDKIVKGKDEYNTCEMQAYDYKLTSWKDRNEMVKYMKGNLAWVEDEACDRLSPFYSNPGTSWKRNEKLWSEYLRDGQFSYTYNERFREQLDQVIRELTLRPNSRQVVLTMYDRHQDMNNWGGKDRVPCSMYYQFYLRQSKLNMIYTMRSCDFLTHFAHDVWLAIELLEYVSSQIGKQTGVFTHFIGSLHAYQKDMSERGIF